MSSSIFPIPPALQVKLNTLLIKYQDIPCSERKYTVDEINFMNKVTPYLERQVCMAKREIQKLRHENEALETQLIEQTSDEMPKRYSNY